MARTVTRTVGALCLAAVVSVSLHAEPAHAAAIDLTQIDLEFDGSPWTLGWRFSVTTPYSVDSLGVYDSGQDGLADSAHVGLWLATGADPIAQATVPAGAVDDLDGFFRFTSIAPTLLTPGTDYVVGAYLSDDLATALFGGNGTVDPLVTVIDVRYSPFGSASFAFPSETDPGTDGAAFLGANIRGSASPVPLPAAAWLFGSGLVGLVGLARRRSSNRESDSYLVG